jgi:class 3 adenylate cyclase
VLVQVETIGDAYVVVGGLFETDVASTAQEPSPTPTPAANELPLTPSNTVDDDTEKDKLRSRLNRLFRLASEMQEYLEQVRLSHNLPINMRIGIHFGDVVTGIVGAYKPRLG